MKCPHCYETHKNAHDVCPSLDEEDRRFLASDEGREFLHIMKSGSRNDIGKLNRANRADAKRAVITKTWKVKGGTCCLRQRPSGKWTAEYDGRRGFIVALASTPKDAIKRLEIDATPVKI